MHSGRDCDSPGKEISGAHGDEGTEYYPQVGDPQFSSVRGGKNGLGAGLGGNVRIWRGGLGSGLSWNIKQIEAL